MNDILLSDIAIDAFARGDRDALYKELGLKPWEISPLDVHDGPSPYPPTTGGAQSWPHAQRLRRALEKAVAERDAK